MRILLVSVNRETAPFPVAPLGLAYVAEVARREGHQVLIVDLCFSRDSVSEVREAVRRFSPALVGISIRNIDNLTYPGSVSYLGEVRAAVAAIRDESSAPIVAGGTGFSIFPRRLMDILDLEFGVVGDGEEAFRSVLRHLSDRIPLPRSHRLLVRGTANDGGDAVPPSPLRGSGRPARELLDNARYLELGGMGNLQTKRGCRFDCLYCTYPAIEGAAVRLRPPGEVADELESMVRELGIDHVFFVDDIFNVPADHAEAVCEEIRGRSLPVEWTCFATPLGMTPRLAEAMRAAGCRGVEFGTDSGAPAMLSSLRKPFSAEAIRAASDSCRDAGLPDAHYLIFGGPGETEDTVRQTFDLFRRIRPRAVIALLGLRIYPNTPLHRVAVREGIVSREDDLLLPRFYLSPRIGERRLASLLAGHAAENPNWVVPGLGIRSDPRLLGALRKLGHRGPLWDMLV